MVSAANEQATAKVDPAIVERAHARGELHRSEMRPYQVAMIDMAESAEELATTDAFTIASEVADKILTADDIDAVIDAAEGGPGDLTDLVGKGFRFVGGTLRWMRSAEKFRAGGFGVYAVFTVALSDGTTKLISTGATNVVAQLRRFQELGVFDSAGEVFDRTFAVAYRDTANGTLFRITRA